MHDNPQAASGLDFALPTHRVLALTGPDATAFAQAQFMNDVGALAPGHWHWSGWLTPKGRVVALFALLRLDTDTIWLVVPDADRDAFASALRRFVFRAKVAIDEPGGLTVTGAFRAPDAAAGPVLAKGPDGSVELDVGGPGRARVLRVVAGPERARPDPSAEADWTRADLEHGLPRLPPSQSGQWTPQQLSLERLGAFSVKKGCYPGQEIVARTHFLGKAKRSLALIASDAPLAVGAQVHGGDQPLGPVIAAAAGDGRALALAVLPVEDRGGTLTVDGAGVREMPLRDGLAR